MHVSHYEVWSVMHKSMHPLHPILQASHARLLCPLHCCPKMSHADCLHDYAVYIVCLLPAITR